METLVLIFGAGKDLNEWQMGARAFVAFFISLVLIRISGRRSFGQRSPFDYSIALLLGAVLSRVVVGASPFAPTLFACFVLVVLHRLLAWLGTRYHWIERLIEGSERELYRHPHFNRQQLRKALITERDLFEAVRQRTGAQTLDEIKAMILERNGEISVIRQ
jgi:uncharacterized membrane protein YcaP (DUF421 family)